MIFLMTGEPGVERFTGFRVKEIDLRAQVDRIPMHGKDSNLPKQSLPNFANKSTYDLAVGLAKKLRSGDPKFNESLAALPDFATFSHSSAAAHFRGEIGRGEVDAEGKQLLSALVGGVLEITGSRPEAKLYVAEDEATDRPVGFLTTYEYGTLNNARNQVERQPYPMQRLLEVLGNAKNTYWQVLIEAGVIPSVNQEQLDKVARQFGNMPIITPAKIETHPDRRREGAASTLAKRLYPGALVVGSTNQPETFMLRHSLLPEDTTILAPAINLEPTVPENLKLLALALQIIPIAHYEDEHKALTNASSPAAIKYSAFTDIGKVIKELPFSVPVEDVNKPVAQKALEEGKMSQREANLFTAEGIESRQYSIISIPPSN